MSERGFRRGLFVLMVAVVVLMSVIYVLPEPAKGQSPPAISYASPSDGATFVDVVPGEGVNWTVNVTDSDGDLQRVRLLSNSSGSWQVFYDSGSLGGVSYHNASGVNPNWTGSWKTYYWRIACYDGSWTNYTYSFTTEYVFGQPHLIFGDFRHALQNDITTSVVYKHNNVYYLWVSNASIDAKRTDSEALDWYGKPKEDVTTGDLVYNAFTYNNIAYIYYRGNLLRYAWYNSTAGIWQTGSTSIDQVWDYGRVAGADVKYYDGKYCLCAVGKSVYVSAYVYFVFYTSNNPLNSFEFGQILEEDGYGYMPSLAIKDGKLILVYRDKGADLHWQVYDGVNWIDKGVIELDIGTPSMVKDPVNDQLVLVYENKSHALVYRVLTNITSGWSEPHAIFIPSDNEDISNPHASYIDRRLIITFAYNRRGNYNIYMICAPDYSSISGLNYTYDRIVFPDATPTSTHVNSTVFAIKNINDRPILNITWHVGKIGDIETANNARVWSNMSGTWQSWDVGSDYNTTKINIESIKGSKWMPGETLYWKIEILDIGGVAETLHASDNNIWYWIELE